MFTLAMVESFAALKLTPSDWQQLCRAVLLGGDYLLWRGEYQENCLQTARLNEQAGQAQRNLDMLTGAGAYADLANQIVLEAILIQTTTFQSLAPIGLKPYNDANTFIPTSKVPISPSVSTLFKGPKSLLRHLNGNPLKSQKQMTYFQHAMTQYSLPFQKVRNWEG